MNAALLAAATQAGGAAAVADPPSFVAATAFTGSPAGNLTTWTPFTGLDLSNCDLAVFIVGAGSVSGLLSTVSSGWNEVGDVTLGSANSNVFWKAAPGASEELALTSAVGTKYTGVLVRVLDANTISLTSTIDGTGSANADPPSHDQGAGRDALWIAAAVWDAIITASAAPATYANLTVQAGQDVASASTAAATKAILATQTENPGAFTSTTEQWAAFTIACYLT